MMISPKLLIHTATGETYAASPRQNAIAYRFGQQIKVRRVRHWFGPFWRSTSGWFFEPIAHYRIPTEDDLARSGT